MGAQSCDIMQIFRIMCKGLWLEIFLIQEFGAVDQKIAAFGSSGGMRFMELPKAAIF
jgi:hypothetical protein